MSEKKTKKPTVKSLAYSILKSYQGKLLETDGVEVKRSALIKIIKEHIGEYDDLVRYRTMKKASGLVSEGQLSDHLKEEMLKMKPKKERASREVYEVTKDRTGKRMLVRARFDGSPFFEVGDSVKISVEVLSDENGTQSPAVVLRRVEAETETETETETEQ